MVRQAASFTQAHVSRAAKGAIAAGLNVVRVEIDPATGKIMVVCRDAVEPQNDAAAAFDQWKGRKNARAA
jgi:hypothetical protein